MEPWAAIAAVLSDPIVNVVLAGAAGGAVKMIRLREGRAGISSIIVGAIVAYYLSPVALAAVRASIGAVIELTPAEAARLGGFMVGSMAMLIIGSLVELVSGWFEKQKTNGKDATK